jgi:hypothetical protein
MWDWLGKRLKTGVNRIHSMGKNIVNVAQKYIGKGLKFIDHTRKSDLYGSTKNLLGRVGLGDKLDQGADYVRGNLADIGSMVQDFRGGMNRAGRDMSRYLDKKMKVGGFSPETKPSIERPPEQEGEPGLF